MKLPQAKESGPGMRAIDCVLFDAGNVLYTLDSQAAWRRFGARCGKDLPEVQAALYREDIFAPFETGRITAISYHRALIELLGCPMGYEEFVSIWNSVIVKREDMFELAAALKNVVRIAVLSNTNELNAAVIEGDLRALTSDVILSCRVGLMKPDPEIYRLASERIGLAPGKILFVDDLSENVDGARSAGLIAHLFTGRRDLIAILGEHGVLVSSLPAAG